MYQIIIGRAPSSGAKEDCERGKRGLPVIIGIYNHNHLESRDEGEDHDQNWEEVSANLTCYKINPNLLKSSLFRKCQVCMMTTDDNFGPETPDELFDELDGLVESARETLKNQKTTNRKNIKFLARLELIELMMEEVPQQDIHITKESDGSWTAEVEYQGIIFMHMSVKDRPQSWG